MSKLSPLFALVALAAFGIVIGLDDRTSAAVQKGGSQLPSPDAEGFISLFNGKDLTNWEGLEGFWSVKDGVIEGSATKEKSKQTFLVLSPSKADPGKFANFELHLKYKFATPTGNSGVQFRSKFVNESTYQVGGYQADFDGACTYDGGFYDEQGIAGKRNIMANRGDKTIWDADNKRKNEPLKEGKAELAKFLKKGDWNSMMLTANGNHFTININGHLMGEMIDNSPKAVKEGLIAIQMHQGYTMTIQVKDVKIKLLKDGQPVKTAATATPPERIKMAKDFKVELIYSVPREKEGSWVNMCVDPQGRLIVSDQGSKGLFRVTPPPIGGPASETKVEKLPAQISSAQGLLCAFDSLYVMVNGGSKGMNGLYRVKASNPGGDFDQVEILRQLQGAGEHGPHAIVPSPDGKSLFVCCGNDTKLTSPLAGSMLPKIWGDDLLFPYIAKFSGVVPPAGCTYRVDPDGKNWELWSAGYRNHYDIAFNRHGDLFTFDSDMEWDMNTPWYRPTRVCMASSGSDFGFRNGSAVNPPRNLDTLSDIVNIGPGSPTGVCFGYTAKFPAKYQEALFICDWSYGRLFAVHLTPEGSAYKAQFEEIATGSPLPLTDVVVNPKDGAMYFAIGGRNTQSGLYRITYVGKESTAPSTGDSTGAEARALRHRLEAFHGKSDPKAVETAWPNLGHQDRYIRFAARVAIEHQEPKQWLDRALKETNPISAINGLLALARVAGKESALSADVKPSLARALDRIDWNALKDSERSDLLRVYTVYFSRFGRPDDQVRDRFIKRFGSLFPTKNYEVNADLCQLLVYLEAPDIAEKALKLVAAAPSQEEQMDYMKSLRNLKTGWTPALHQSYFEWFHKAANYKGGQRFQAYINEIKQTAMANLTAEEKENLKTVLAAKPAAPTEIVKARPTVKQWTVDELTPIVERSLKQRDFERGRLLFGEAKCFACHRYDNEGGSLAPDLTGASGRYSVRDLLDKIINPSKAVSDQYASTVFTLKDGKIIIGRVVNLQGDNMSVQTDMLAPAKLTSVKSSSVESYEPSKVSPMPTGLLDTFNQDEILDLVAFVLSRGDRKHEMFRK
jgi:putative heme-binding domain-containing protein